jgi:serine phosphatase RsbU (regulator of sigma subunit)
MGISFLILPPGPINPLHGLIWLRGPFFVLSGLVLLWLCVLPMSRRAAIVFHLLVAVPPIAVAAEYVHLRNYGPAATLFILGLGLALSPLAPPRPVSSGYRPDALGVVLGLALAGQGAALLAKPQPDVIPYGLYYEIAILFVAFGVVVAATHAAPRVPTALRWAAHLGAGASALALWVILALGIAPILWLLNLSGFVVGAGFMSLLWLSPRMPAFAPDTVRTRLAGGLFNGALIPLLIAVPLVLSTPGLAGDASDDTREMTFGIVIALSIAAGAAGWWFALILVTPLSRLIRGVERIAAGVRPLALAAGGPREVDDLATAVQTMAGRLDQEMQALTEARDQHKAVAEKLQRALQVPIGVFTGIDVATVYRSASEVAELGGDFYDVFRTAAGRIGFLIGDVSGRGLDAAAQAVLTRASLRAFIYATDSPAEALSHANRLLLDTNTRGFVTVWFGMLDRASGLLVYATAGHPPPVLATSGGVSLLQGSGPVLGVFHTAAFHDLRLHLTPGDTLVLYTDGLTEAKKAGVLFGEERVVAEVTALGDVPPADIALGLYKLAVDHAGGDLADDLAVLALRLEPA